jgi:hypothetical protein
MGVPCGTPEVLRFTRRVVSPPIVTRPGGTPGSKRRGPCSCGRPSDAKASSFLRRKPVVPRGVRDVTRGRAGARNPRAKRVAHAKATRSVALLRLFQDACASRAARDAGPRTVPKRSGTPSWRSRRPPVFSGMTGRGIIPVRRRGHGWPSRPIASRGIRCRRMRPTTIPLNIWGRRPRSARPLISTARNVRCEPYRWRRP